ncbi:hypothetical protein [Tautonia sociabilis]|uniref:DUF4175 family protein n=1 Tax=Tautonia sociabilis TaxID=2080755 RepID=A0A432MNN3_9BACT|nr:hypothetical protein [Tautonia sociabilis]RUL88716.1 hypothetical protein TsocGM_06160 [Tautonia sociabilis]
MTIAPPEPSRAPAPRLPGEVRRALRGVARRLRAAAAMRGLGTLLAVSAAIAAGAMAVDFVRPMPGPARWAAWLAWAGGTAAVLVASAIRPVARRHRKDVLAAVAARGCPDEAGGRVLTSAVSLAEGGPSAHGSPELIAALVDRSAAEARRIDPRRAVPLAQARRRLAVGLAAAGLAALPAVAVPDPIGRLALRFLRPWSDEDSVGLLAIQVEPGDVVLARGEELAVAADLRPRFGTSAPDAARIEWTDPDGTAHSLPMEPFPQEGDGTRDKPAGRSFGIALPSVSGPISYRVLAGSARTRAFRVEVVDPPRVASARWTVEPPGYTGEAGETLVDPTAAVVRQDSRVTIVVQTDRPAHRVWLTWPVAEDGGADRAVEVELEPSEDGISWTAEVAASVSGAFAIISEDEHGLIGRPGTSGSLEVLPDAPPVVALADQDGAAGPGDLLLLPVAARDDLAVCSAELHVAISRAGDGRTGEGEGEAGAGPSLDEVEVRSIALEGLGSSEAKGVAELDLAPLGLGDGDSVSVRVRVLDNRPAPRGPNEGWSAPMPVAIVADVEKRDAEQLEARLRPVREALEALARQAAENHRRVVPLRNAADRSRRDDEAWTEDEADDLDRLAEAARALVDRLHLLSRDLEADPTLGALADPVREAAETEADAAREALDDARLPDEPGRPEADERLDDLRRAEAELGAASKRLDDLNRQLNALARAAAARPELAELADREARLADQADALADAAEDAPPAPEPDPDAPPPPPIDPEDLRQLQASQQELARALAELLRKAPALEDDAAEARADAEAARRQLDRAHERDPSQSVDATRAAAEAMRRASQRLRLASGPADPSSRADRLARQLAQSSPDPAAPPSEGDPGSSPSGSAAAGASDPDADLSLRSSHSWGDLPGHLRTELLRSSPDRYRPDFADTIRLYFREIARGASGSTAP